MILPSRIAKSTIHTARLETKIALASALPTTAYFLQLSLDDTAEGYQLTHTVRPTLGKRDLRTLSNLERHRFWKFQGELRHVITPIELKDLTRVLNENVLGPDGRLRNPTAGNPPFHVYQPLGPWELVHPNSAYDLAHRARLDIPIESARLRAPIEVLEKLVALYPVHPSPYRMVLTYN